MGGEGPQRCLYSSRVLEESNLICLITTPLSPPILSMFRCCLQVDSITDSTQDLLRDVSEGKELPKAELDNLQKRRRLIKLE